MRSEAGSYEKMRWHRLVTLSDIDVTGSFSQSYYQHARVWCCSLYRL